MKARRKPISVPIVIGLAVVLLTLVFLGYRWRAGVSHLKAASTAASAPAQLGSKCKFTAGDRAGEVADFSPLPPLPVGSACNDGTSSSGVVVR